MKQFDLLLRQVPQRNDVLVLELGHTSSPSPIFPEPPQSAGCDPSKTTWHILLQAGRHIAPDKIGPDRQFTVTTVDQHRQLDALGSAMIHQGIHGGPDGAAGEEHIIHQHDLLPFQGEGISVLPTGVVRQVALSNRHGRG